MTTKKTEQVSGKSAGLTHTPKRGVLYGVGVGPGDPELLTLKAVRIIRSADMLVYLSNNEGLSQARQIAHLAVGTKVQDSVFSEDIYKEGAGAQIELPLIIPMSTDRTLANRVYDEGAEKISEKLRQGGDVAFLCEGDPLLFGSFNYLLERLNDHFLCQVVPGISSVNAATAALLQPLTRQDESFAVVTGRQTEAELVAVLEQHDAVVILKAGLARPTILAALRISQRTADAQYLEYIGRDNQCIEMDVTELPDIAGPYFSLFVVSRATRHQRAHELKNTANQ